MSGLEVSKAARLAVAVVVLALVLTIVVSGSSARPGAGHAESIRPNVVLVTVDDARLDDMRYMPTVQRLLQRQGTTFSDAFLSYPLCAPSRASILTGQYAHNHGVRHVDYPAGSYRRMAENGANQSTLPLWLQQSGYHTSMVGKYLNGYTQYSANHFGVENAQPDPGWSSWKATLNTYNYRNLTIRHHPGTFAEYEGNYSTNVLNEIGVKVVRRQESEPKPFFLWLSHIAPHVGLPHEPDDPKRLPTPNVDHRDRDTFSDLGNVRSPAFNQSDMSGTPAAVRKLPKFGNKMSRQIREFRQQRVESLQAVDRGIRRLVRTLRETGQLRETVIIFTSDNGYSLGEHRLPKGKILPYQEIENTPLYMRGPGIPSNRVVNDPVSMSTDLAPTILDLTDTSAPYQPDGVSLNDLMRHPGPSDRHVVVEAWRPGGAPLYTGLRTERYLYVKYATGEVELYDLHRDPHQLDSLARDPKYRDIRKELARKLAIMHDCRGRGCHELPDPGRAAAR